MRISLSIFTFLFILVCHSQAQINTYMITYKTEEIKGKTAEVKAQKRALSQTELTIVFDSSRVKQSLSIGNLVTRSFVMDLNKNKGFLMVSGSIGNYGTKLSDTTFKTSVKNIPSEKIELFTEDTLIVTLNEEDSLKRKEFICHRAVITNKAGLSSTYWYTPLYSAPWTDNKFLQDNLPGLPLKMIIETNEMIATMMVEELELEIPRLEEYLDVENLPLGFMEVTLRNFKKLTNEED